jgi:hypothetical protein
MIYFLGRFQGRKQKDKTFSIAFWVTDNWVELLIILLVDISIMLLLITNDISIDAAQFIPSWLVKIGDLGIAWLVGFGLSAIIYNIILKKIADAKP